MFKCKIDNQNWSSFNQAFYSNSLNCFTSFFQCMQSSI